MIRRRRKIGEVLDTYRRTVLWKLDGLSRADAMRPMVSSGTSLLGVVKHLAFVERYWFQRVLAGRDVSLPWSSDDPDADWRIEADETVAEVVELFERQVAISREVVDGIDSLDEEFVRRDETLSARSILLHMIEEIARHAGHMDIMREMIDDATGYLPPRG